MRLIAMFMMRQGAGEEDPIFLAGAYELNHIGWFKRGTFKEALNFSARTVCK